MIRQISVPACYQPLKMVEVFDWIGLILFSYKLDIFYVQILSQQLFHTEVVWVNLNLNQLSYQSMTTIQIKQLTNSNCALVPRYYSWFLSENKCLPSGSKVKGCLPGIFLSNHTLFQSTTAGKRISSYAYAHMCIPYFSIYNGNFTFCVQSSQYMGLFLNLVASFPSTQLLWKIKETGE